MSFQNGHFPDSLKSALVTPLITKPSLDCKNLTKKQTNKNKNNQKKTKQK